MVPIFTFQKTGAYYLETFNSVMFHAQKRKCVFSRGAYCLGNITVHYATKKFLCRGLGRFPSNFWLLNPNSEVLLSVFFEIFTILHFLRSVLPQ